MAKWGAGYRWGAGTKWGQAGGVTSAPFQTDVIWIVKINWIGSQELNESDYVRNISMTRGRQHYVNAGGSGFEQMAAGRVSITMDNSNGRFDPYNASGPLYGYLLPGRKIQISVYDVTTKQIHVRFTGHISDIQPSSGINEVTITAEDGIRWLSDAEYSSGVTYAKTVSEAIDLVLSFVNWPYQRNIQPSLQPLQVFEPGKGNAATVIQQLAEANLGAFFIDRCGKATFYPVSYDVTTSHAIDQAQLLREIRILQPWETVRNKINVIANRKGKRPSTAVWTLAGIEEFEIGESIAFGASFKSSDGLTVEAIKANTQSDGNGSDVSGNFTITKSSATSTTCTITVTNNSGYKAYLLSLRLLGNEIVSSPETCAATDSTSIASYGPRTFNLDNQFLQDRAFATAYATMLKDFLKDPHKDPIIQIQERPDIQYDIDLYDKIVLTSTKLGVSATFTVGGLSEEWLSDTGQSVKTTYYLQTVLYDNTVITPDPFTPGALPNVTSPDMPYWYDPYIPPLPPYTPPEYTDLCLQGTSPTDYIAVSPDIKVLTTSPGVLVSKINYPCTIRPGGVTYKSSLDFTGRFYDFLLGLWTLYGYNDIVRVTAFNSAGSDILTGTVSGGGTAQAMRTAVFSPTAATEVSGFRIYLDYSGVDGIPSSNVTETSDGTRVLFDFTDSAQGWYAFHTAGYQDYLGPACATHGGTVPSSKMYWGGGKLNHVLPDLYGNVAETFNWEFEPPHLCTAKTGATFSVESYNVHWGPSAMIMYSEADNKYDEYNSTGYDVVQTLIATVSSDYNDLPVEKFGYYRAADTSSAAKTGWIDNVILTGFEWTSSQKKIEIDNVYVRNVCGSGLT